MSKPIQIAVTHSRCDGEQFGAQDIYVLCDDGKIWNCFSQSGTNYGWSEITGPWMAEEKG